MITIKEWLLKNYNDEIEYIAEYGSYTGKIYELIYNNDCLNFYKDFEDEIWDMFNNETCDEIRLYTLKDITSIDDLKMNLTHWAVEKIAYEIQNEREEKDNER